MEPLYVAAAVVYIWVAVWIYGRHKIYQPEAVAESPWAFRIACLLWLPVWVGYTFLKAVK